MTDVTCEDRNLTVCEVGDMLGKGKSSVQKILSNNQITLWGLHMCSTLYCKATYKNVRVLLK